VDPGADVGELGLVKLEPFEQRRGEVGLLGRFQIELIRLQDIRLAPFEGLGDLRQGGVLRFGLGRGQLQRGRFGQSRTLGDARFA